MKNKNELVDKVASKTNLRREDIFQLAHDLQTKDLNNEQDIRNFIMTVDRKNVVENIGFTVIY